MGNCIWCRKYACSGECVGAGNGGLSKAEAQSTPSRAGHPRFYELTVAEMELHDRKNGDYAGGGKPLGNFERRATILGLYPGLDLSKPEVVALVDMLKQLDAALWLLATGRRGNVEGVPARLADVSCYAKLAQIMDEEAHPDRASA